MEEWVAIIFFFREPRLLSGHSPDLCRCIRSGLQHGQTQLSLWMNRAKGFTYFFASENLIFAYSTTLFIEWNLREFSPCWLRSSLNIACSSLLKARVEAFLHMLGLQVIYIYFLFVPSLLPTVMDPSSVCTFTIHVVFCHANLDICQVVWILDSFVVPTLVYNKALQEGFNVCEHRKCFILPMHRLGCWKERLLYSVPALVCAISLMIFCVYLIAAVFFSIHLLHS